jgi:hypothetical protein
MTSRERVECFLSDAVSAMTSELLFILRDFLFLSFIARRYLILYVDSP